MVPGIASPQSEKPKICGVSNILKKLTGRAQEKLICLGLDRGMEASPRQRRHRTPTGQDGGRRHLAMRRIRLDTTWAGATGIALPDLFVCLAPAGSNHASSASVATSPQSPISPHGAYRSGGIAPTFKPDLSSPYSDPYEQGQGNYSPPRQALAGAS